MSWPPVPLPAEMAERCSQEASHLLSASSSDVITHNRCYLECSVSAGQWEHWPWYTSRPWNPFTPRKISLGCLPSRDEHHLTIIALRLEPPPPSQPSPSMLLQLGLKGWPECDSACIAPERTTNGLLCFLKSPLGLRDTEHTHIWRLCAPSCLVCMRGAGNKSGADDCSPLTFPQPICGTVAEFRKIWHMKAFCSFSLLVLFDFFPHLFC